MRFWNYKSQDFYIFYVSIFDSDFPIEKKKIMMWRNILSPSPFFCFLEPFVRLPYILLSYDNRSITLFSVVSKLASEQVPKIRTEWRKIPSVIRPDSALLIPGTRWKWHVYRSQERDYWLAHCIPYILFGTVAYSNYVCGSLVCSSDVSMCWSFPSHWS